MPSADNGSLVRAVANYRFGRGKLLFISFFVVLRAGIGCVAPVRSYQPPVDPNTLDDTTFLHYLASVPVVTVDEGMRAILMVQGVPAQGLTYEERSAALERAGAVKSAWRLSAQRILDKGTLAHMLRVTCGLPLGLNEWMAGKTGLAERRYALKTCVYESLMPYALPHEPVTGGELITSMTQAENRLDVETGKSP